MIKFAVIAVVAAAILGAVVGVGSKIQAHEGEDFVFTGIADQDCLPGNALSWSATFAIDNDADANPFGIVDTNPDVTFAPLEDDAAPGEFIPPGDSASATLSDIALSVASVTLDVTHDVTNGPDVTYTSDPVARPAACAPTTGSITVVKDTDPDVNNECFSFDFDPGSDIACLEDDDDPVVRAGLAPGDYRIIEDAKAGWLLTDIDCDGDSNADEDEGNRTAEIDLDAGEDVVCTFNNVRVATPVAPAPTATPQVILVPGPTQIVERIVTQTIRPPSTGDAGLK